MNTLQAGQLRTRITIQCRLPGGNLGHPSNDWTDVAQVWANIRFGSGAEAIRASQIVSLASVSIRIRWREGITAGMRVVSKGLAYDIQAVLPDMAGRKHVDLVCKVPT